MPGLVDLHRHLDGSLRASTLAELARAAGREVPADLRFSPGMGLAAALARFELTVSLLQELDAVARVAAEMCEDAAADGVTTLEVRFAPQLHGASIGAAVDAALAGLGGRAGLILCALYGDSPALVDALVDAGAARPGVVGLDLAGGPASGQRWGMADYAPAFRRAAARGLGRTVHAGEGRPPAEIRAAVELLGAQRIGHGTTLLDDPAVLALVVDRAVTIEACPTSNWHTGAVRALAEHPLPRWLDLGVRVCLGTDNTLLSDVTASAERARARALPGMDDRKLALLDEHGRAAAFVR